MMPDIKAHRPLRETMPDINNQPWHIVLCEETILDIKGTMRYTFTIIAHRPLRETMSDINNQPWHIVLCEETILDIKRSPTSFQ